MKDKPTTTKKKLIKECEENIPKWELWRADFHCTYLNQFASRRICNMYMTLISKCIDNSGKKKKIKEDQEIQS